MFPDRLQPVGQPGSREPVAHVVPPLVWLVAEPAGVDHIHFGADRRRDVDVALEVGLVLAVAQVAAVVGFDLDVSPRRRFGKDHMPYVSVQRLDDAIHIAAKWPMCTAGVRTVSPGATTRSASPGRGPVAGEALLAAGAIPMAKYNCPSSLPLNWQASSNCQLPLQASSQTKVWPLARSRAQKAGRLQPDLPLRPPSKTSVPDANCSNHRSPSWPQVVL